MRTIATPALVLGLALALTQTVFAQGNVYRITVEVDDNTAEDLALIDAVLQTTPDGEAPRSLRKLAAGVGGELAIVGRKRISHDNLLTLDDGSVVALTEEDAVEVVKACTPFEECHREHGATILKLGHAPYAMFVRGERCTIEMDFRTQPPLVGKTCRH